MLATVLLLAAKVNTSPAQRVAAHQTATSTGLTLRDAHRESACSVGEWAARATAVQGACCPKARIVLPSIGSGKVKFTGLTQTLGTLGQL